MSADVDRHVGPLRDRHSGAWYAVVQDRGVFRSTDGGNTWVDINAGLPDLTRLRIVVDPQTPDRLFAAAGGLGLWSRSAPAPDLTSAPSLC